VSIENRPQPKSQIIKDPKGSAREKFNLKVAGETRFYGVREEAGGRWQSL